jgi:hypothetical protein
MRRLSPVAKLVRLYVLTCPSRVSEGLYQLPLGIVAHDLDLDAGEVEQALDELDRAGLVSYDLAAEVVLDRTALKYQPLRNGSSPTGEVRPDKRITGALSRYEQTPDTPLKDELYLCARRHSPDLAYAMGARWPELTHLEEGRPRTVHGQSDRSPTGADTPSDTASSDVIHTCGQEAPSEGLGSPLQGASRAELRRDEVREGDGPLCDWCREQPAKLEHTGQPFAYEGRPWCGWCEPVTPDEDPLPAPARGEGGGS